MGHGSWYYGRKWQTRTQSNVHEVGVQNQARARQWETTQALTVSQGFLHIPGVNYTKIISLVATKTSMHTLIGVAIFFGWAVEMFDIEAASLNAKCKKETFIKWLKGVVKIGMATEEMARDYCIMLEKAMRRTVDAAML